MLPLRHDWKAGQHQTEKRVHLRPARQNLWANENSLKLSQFSLHTCKPNHTILARLRRFRSYLNRFGAMYYVITKNKNVRLREIGIL